MITIIIPVRNQKEYLEKCLESIKKNTPPDKYEIFLIDNGSDKLTNEFIRNSGHRYIACPENLGFGRAINLAIKRCSGDIILMNSDVEVTPNWLQELIKYDNAIVGAVGKYPTGQIQHAGAFLNAYGNGQHYQQVPDGEIEYVSFFCAYIPRKIISDIGLLNELYYPAYYEDSSMCYQARQKGYKILVSSNCVVLHHEGMGKKEHHLDIEQLNLINRQKFFREWEELDYTQDKPIKIAFAGRTAGELSYPIILRTLALGLNNDPEIDCAVYPEETIHRQWHHTFEFKKLLQKKFDPNRICIRYSEAKYAYLAYKRDILYSTLETDRWPKEWVYQANMFKRCWTTSNFVKGIMEKSGIKVPIDVIPHGVDKKIWYPRPNTSKKFTFFSDSMYGNRKMVNDMLKAFCDEFKPTEPVRFLLNSPNIEDRLREIGIPNAAKYLEKFGNNRPEIVISPDWKLMSKMPELYQEAHVYIGVSSEGFGLGNLQAMFMKIPTIGANWGGITDYSNDKNSLQVKGKLVPAYQPWLYEHYVVSNWYKPDYYDLRAKMRYAYENYNEMKKLAEQAFADNANKYLWEKIIPAAKESIKKI